MHWFNQKRILSSIGYMFPAKAEKLYYDPFVMSTKPSHDSDNKPFGKTGAIQPQQ